MFPAGPSRHAPKAGCRKTGLSEKLGEFFRAANRTLAPESLNFDPIWNLKVSWLVVFSENFTQLPRNTSQQLWQGPLILGLRSSALGFGSTLVWFIRIISDKPIDSVFILWSTRSVILMYHGLSIFHQPAIVITTRYSSAHIVQPPCSSLWVVIYARNTHAHNHTLYGHVLHVYVIIINIYIYIYVLYTYIHLSF